MDALRCLDSSSTSASLKSIGLSVALPSVSLLFGFLSHGFPDSLVEAARLMGAVGLAKAVSDPVVDATKRRATVKADPLYFLLKMDEAWKQAREACG